MNNLRIAVCFNGQLRSGIEASKSILNYLSGHMDDIDFFIHTWTENSFRIPFNISLPERKNEKIPQEVLDKFVSIYKPINIIVEDSSEYYQRIVRNYGSTGDLVNFWHSFYYSGLLKKTYEHLNNFRYDLVLRLRPDVIFPPDRKLTNDVNNFLENKSAFYYHNLFGDTLQMGSSDTFDVATEFYKLGNFYGDHFWPMEKFINYMTENSVVTERLKDNRATVMRQNYKHLDPLEHYYQLNMINSLEYENINFARENHIYTYENLNDSHWLSKAKESIIEIFRGDVETASRYFDVFKQE